MSAPRPVAEYLLDLFMLAAVLVAALLPLPGLAQTPYPNKPVRLIVAYAAGGVSDLLARVVAAPLPKELGGQNMVVENRLGAGGLIGTQACRQAAPDGYTLCLGSASSMVLAPLTVKEANYDALRDFVPITLLANFPGVLSVNPKIGVNSPEQFLRWAKANPGAAFGSSGVGTLFYFMGLHLNHEHGTKLEPANYKGGSQAVLDAVGGFIPVVMDALTASLPHIKSGALIPILQSGATRSSALPNVPTASESILPKFKVDSFQGVFAPAGTSPEIVAKLGSAIRAVGSMPEVRARMVDMGGVPVLNTPAEFTALIRESKPIFEELVKSTGMKAQ